MIRTGHVVIVAALFLFVAACSGADEPLPTATPKAATPTPAISVNGGFPVFSVETIDGETVRLEDLLGTAPVYVLFVPGVDDELDRAQIRALQANYTRFEKLGASVVVVATDLPTEVLRLRDELKIGFPLIADPLSVVANDWQVFDLFGSGGGGPASFEFECVLSV